MTDHRITWHGEHKAGLTRGERAADILRNGMGSWTFVGLFILFMAAWAAVNTFLLATRARYGQLAGLQGAILLIAAKRQDAIAAAMSLHDFETDVQAKIEIERLMALNRQQLEMLQGVRTLLERTQGIGPDAADEPREGRETG